MGKQFLKKFIVDVSGLKVNEKKIGHFDPNAPLAYTVDVCAPAHINVYEREN